MDTKKIYLFAVIFLLLLVICLGFFAVDTEAGNTVLLGVALAGVGLLVFANARKNIRLFIIIVVGIAVIIVIALIALGTMMGDISEEAAFAPMEAQTVSEQAIYAESIETIVETSAFTSQDFSVVTTLEDVRVIQYSSKSDAVDYDRPVNMYVDFDILREGVEINIEGDVYLDDDPASFLIDFGDGATSPGAKAAHVYDSPGRYNYSLEVTTQDGETYHLRGQIDVDITSDDALEFSQRVEAEAVGLLLREVAFNIKKSTGGGFDLGDLFVGTSNLRVNIPEIPKNTFFEVGSGHSLEILSYQNKENVTWVNSGKVVKFSYIDPRWRALRSVLAIFYGIGSVGSLLVMVIGFVLSFAASQVVSPMVGEAIKDRIKRKNRSDYGDAE